MARVSTGTKALDSMVEGGLPRGGLILISGGPGTGKTEFAAKFLAQGIANGDPGLYVSFSENRSQFLSEIEHRDSSSARLLDSQNLRFLDLFPAKPEASGGVAETILRQIEHFRIKNLVIDSYSALSLSFNTPEANRAFLQIVVHKIVRSLGCTTLLISEERSEGVRTFGDEEFAADGVLRLSTSEIEGRLLRYIDIVKMRGTRLARKRVVYSLEGGMTIFEPSEGIPPSMAPPAKRPPRGRTKAHPTGIPDLDRILGGGLLPGTTLLLSSDITLTSPERELFTGPVVSTFLASGKAVAIVSEVGKGNLQVTDYLNREDLANGLGKRLKGFCRGRLDSAREASA